MTIAAKQLALLVLSLLLTLPNLVGAQENFYKGKTIRMIVGTSAGGGFDTYTRTIARHFGKHVPGQPAIVVENMAGAGHLIAANHMYKVAKPDGLTPVCDTETRRFNQEAAGLPGDVGVLTPCTRPGRREAHGPTSARNIRGASAQVLRSPRASGPNPRHRRAIDSVTWSAACKESLTHRVECSGARGEADLS